MLNAIKKIVPQEEYREAIAPTLKKYGNGLLSLMAENYIRVRVLSSDEKYRDVSEQISALIPDLDAWPVTPIGMFVSGERMVYLRRVAPMTIAHEFGHALDLVLGLQVGSDKYLSVSSWKILQAFEYCRSFVSPYAATRIDEYFAESVRAYLGVHDNALPWPRASRARLKTEDPRMFEIISQIFKAEVKA